MLLVYVRSVSVGTKYVTVYTNDVFVWEVPPFLSLHTDYWQILTDVSRQPVCPIFDGQEFLILDPLRWDRMAVPKRR